MPRVQQGVTLIELMMVALTISIVMTVAMPVYQGYLARARQDAARFACALDRATRIEARQTSAEPPPASASDCGDEAG